MYELIFRTIITRLDPEFAHRLGTLVMRFLPPKRFREPLGGGVQTLGRQFPNRLGLAAGFDKNGRYLASLARRGFGHIEMGTVTGQSQSGNPKPRLFRLVQHNSIINRMGFNNEGAPAVAQRLRHYRKRHPEQLIGVNIGKTKVVDLDRAVDDYVLSARLFKDLCDYLVVNVSSPNTPGLRGLQELEQLEPLLREIRVACEGTPLLVKIAPDLTDDQVQSIAQLAVRIGLDGIVATNTTLSREQIPLGTQHRDEAGGLSGPVLAERSLEILQLLRATVPENFCVISVGGVTTQADFLQRLEAGATLVQAYTAFIYGGPNWPQRVLES